MKDLNKKQIKKISDWIEDNGFSGLCEEFIEDFGPKPKEVKTEEISFTWEDSFTGEGYWVSAALGICYRGEKLEANPNNKNVCDTEE